jgi:hypothetical protein
VNDDPRAALRAGIRWFSDGGGTCQNALTGCYSPWTLARCVGVAHGEASRVVYYVPVGSGNPLSALTLRIAVPLSRVARDRKPSGKRRGGRARENGSRGSDEGVISQEKGW